MKVYAWLIDLIHCRKNCPTGMISGWIQKVTEHCGTIQYINLFFVDWRTLSTQSPSRTTTKRPCCENTKCYGRWRMVTLKNEDLSLGTNDKSTSSTNVFCIPFPHQNWILIGNSTTKEHFFIVKKRTNDKSNRKKSAHKAAVIKSASGFSTKILSALTANPRIFPAFSRLSTCCFAIVLVTFPVLRLSRIESTATSFR